jgi:hypothetical protein
MRDFVVDEELAPKTMTDARTAGVLCIFMRLPFPLAFFILVSLRRTTQGLL